MISQSLVFFDMNNFLYFVLVQFTVLGHLHVSRNVTFMLMAIMASLFYPYLSQLISRDTSFQPPSALHSLQQNQGHVFIKHLL